MDLRVARTLIIYQSNFMSASENIAKTEILEVVALALRHSPSGEVMLARRAPGESGAGEWEFPGGKIEPGETQKQALVREIQEELSFVLISQDLRPLGEHVHQYPQRKVKIYLWEAEVAQKPEFILCDHDRVGWFTKNDIAELNLTAGDKYFISLIK
jgi:8-oxo-dGTP diphosphatase